MLHRTLDEGDLEDEDDECFAPLMRMEAFCRRNVDDLLNNEGLIVDGDSRRRLEFAFGAAIQRASQGLKALARGEFASPFSAPNTRSGLAARTEPTSNTDPVLFDRLLEGWKRERRPMEKTVYEYERAFRDLAAHLGHSDASLVKAKDLVGWKEKMLAAELKPKTIRDAKLAPIRAIMQWAVLNELLVDNPAQRVTIDLKKRAGETKRGFDDKEAATLLAAARRESNPVKRWIPF